MTVTIEDGAVTSVTGNTCPRGPKYAHDEVVAPKRMLTSTVQVKGGLLPLLPVVSKTTLPKERILDCAAALRQIAVKAPVTEADYCRKYSGIGSRYYCQPFDGGTSGIIVWIKLFESGFAVEAKPDFYF